MTKTPQLRIVPVNSRELARDKGLVLYWMHSYRRFNSNFALQRAVEVANELERPLLVVETLECGSRWSSPRLSDIALKGMRQNAARALEEGVAYRAFLEREPGALERLMNGLAECACCVVSDDYPDRRLQSRVAAVAEKVPVRFELVDSNGMLPLRAAQKVYPSAFSFRRFLQEALPAHLAALPDPDPLKALRLQGQEGDWKAVDSAADFADLSRQNLKDYVDGLPHPCAVHAIDIAAGPVSARAEMESFLTGRLKSYSELRNNPEQNGASGLSGHLRHGHLSVFEIFSRLTELEEWNPSRLGSRRGGQREGWWGMSASAEAFLDELITWREIGLNMAWQVPDYDQWESLPEWARRTLDEHTSDPRKYLYSLESFEAATTHDELWNAAQRQLVLEGRIHNYLRMLWGKKILEWTPSPQAALEIMIELNNKYAVDGQDPNSYSGIFWVLGRYDRPWGPERPIFGKIRYMTSENTARKYPVTGYIRRYAR